MTNDEDLMDALVKHKLKSLTLNVELVESPPESPPNPSQLEIPLSSVLISEVDAETSDIISNVGDCNCEDHSGSEEQQQYDREASTYSSFEPVDSSLQSLGNNANEMKTRLEEESGGNSRFSAAPKANYKCYDCGVYPIVGPWYTSIPFKKQLYAACIYRLCEDCFVQKPWRHSTTIQFRLIDECAKCHQYKPDVQEHPNITRQSLTREHDNSEEGNDILLCDWCFKGLTHRVSDAENRSLSNLSSDIGWSRRRTPSVSIPTLQMLELLPTE
ncbi:hypothetical protein R1sor_008460 [Riccia sorocarpa]|uniref:Uncharacterized protein n=1 Tax=Riccia sorocarpa TaxID=122646 RepID=A0ABD3HVM5_9MARC